MRTKRILIDFDGVIHAYRQGFKDGSIYDPPVKGSHYALRKLEELGYEIVIFTARTDFKAVRAWLKQNGFKDYVVTNIKMPAIAYIDDRAYRFTDWVKVLSYFQ